MHVGRELLGFRLLRGAVGRHVFRAPQRDRL